MEKAQRNILNIYWGLINNLSNKWKLDLIEKLSKSVRENMNPIPNRMELAFGAWEDDRTADELINELTSSRNTDRKIEDF